MTFSIIGFDPLKNRFGVAVSSCHIAVGSTVSFVRSQVGAVATQGQTNPYLGIRSLESLQSCSDSKIVLEDLIKEDFGREKSCLLYTSPSPRDKRQSRMPSSA